MVLVGTKQYKLRRMIMSHMAADSLPELFEMADNIGVHLIHFQNKPGRPHFDICQQKKKQAIELGAKLVHDSEIIKMLKANFTKPEFKP